ncbi:MAG: glycoside hydrolase family 3 C-terminal domain-containing protein [Clostridia bacterium]|nr:glycoside hydrolase family 3 C-terminal domain-containing protein [Clostridia bacterium]
MKIRALISIMLVALLVCSVLPFTASAYVVSDGADKSYAAATEAMVLLKNENNALPLTSTDRIAIFGEGQVYTDGKTGGFFLMGRGSGYFIPSETPKSPCDILASYVDAGKLGGVYTALSDSYKAAKVVGKDFTYSPTDAEYTAAAEYANKAIYIVNRTSAEGSDISKENFYLTSAEQAELKKVCAAFNGKPVVVVLNSGSMINCGFANGRVDGIYADAVITATYLGIRGTDALCAALVGDVNPSGKTVDTYAKALEDYPSYDGFYESKDYVTYYEDIYAGYRYFETFNVDVDYPFGYGLSYTTFDISDVTYSEENGKITVTAKVTNTGDVAGKEVIQVYFGAPQKGIGSAVLSKASKELCGFTKTSLLAAGASETVSVSFDIDTMASYDDLGMTGYKSAYVMEAGDYTVYVGNSVRNTTVAGTYTEETLRVTEQLTELCEPTTAFERMTFDGTETVGETSSFRSELLHNSTHKAMIYPAEPYQFTELLENEITVDEFLGQMSNGELATVALMTNASPTNTGAWGASSAVAEKYGIPLAYTCDGPAGIRHTTKGTGLPCATALACTWNKDVVAVLGDVIGRECAITDIDVWLAPAVNLHHYPLCGRNFEYFSEDPYISGVMAAEIIKGVESHGIVCSIKHFIANEKEQNRNQSDSRMSERALREIYLLPFKMAVDAGVGTVMTSYNFLNGTETSENAELLRGILRGEWGFDGVVTTDWSNDSNLAKEVIAGNNVHSSMHYGADGSAYEYHMENKYAELMEGVENGTVSRSLLIENAAYMMDLLTKTMAAARLENPEIWTVNASGDSKFEAENYTYKHGYARPEKSGSRTVMSYVRATAMHIPYLTYTLEVEEAGTYVLTAGYANASADANANAIRVFVNGIEQFTNFNATSTSGWSKVADAEIGTITLPAGTVELKVKSAANRACGNFDYFILTPIEEAYTAISTPAELIALMSDSAKWSGNYYLTTDIDITNVSGQGPIGTNATNFTGTFDGNGYSITGLSLTTSTEQDFGLFGKIKGAAIRNLTVYGDVTSTKAGNAVVGGIVGTLDPDSFVVNCANYVDVTYNNTAKAAKGVGGVAGYLYAGSSNTGTVVKNCTNYGEVKSITGGKDAIVGGIAGIINDNGAGVCELKYCQNFGTVYGEGIKVGGIVGYLAQAAAGGGAEVAYCANHGDVTATKGTQARMGGIVGYANSASVTDGKEPNITFCINYGNVITDISYESAGVLGYNVGVNVDNCVNLGTLTAKDSATATKPMGGVIGKTFTGLTAIVYEITNCYTTSGDVIPAISYEKPDYFAFTDCFVESESDLESGNTTLTYGNGGYIIANDELVLANPHIAIPRADVNADGKADIIDILVTIKSVLNNSRPKNESFADLNDDGKISLIDVIAILKVISQ